MTTPDLSQPTVSIIIPALNEARRLGPALLQIRQYAERTGLRAEVIVVDDGSTDDTSQVARAFEPGPLSIVVLRNLANRGKGYSVRRGMRRGRGEYLLMTDADQSTPIWQIEKALPFLIAGFDVVIGSRDLEDSQVTKKQTWQRHFMGRVMRFLRKRMMLRDINDTQCGFKVFSQEAGKRIFAALRDKGFAFDCEVLLLARRMGYRIKETGVIWCNDADSRVRPFRDPLRMIVSLVRIRWRLRGGRPPGGPPGH